MAGGEALRRLLAESGSITALGLAWNRLTGEAAVRVARGVAASPALQACGKRPGGCANSSWCYNQVLPGALLVLNGTFYL